MTEERMRNNSGLVVGGNLTAGAVAVGDHARASNVAGAVEQRRAELEEMITRHAAELDNAPVVQRAAADVETELAKKEPDKNRLQQLLDTITANARSVTGVVLAAEEARKAIMGLM